MDHRSDTFRRGRYGGERPPRICYLGLSRWPNGPGDPRIFQKQLPALAQAGYDVVALITGHGDPWRLHGVLIKPMGWQGGLMRRMRYLPDVVRQAVREQADCYIFGNFELLLAGALLKLCTGAYTVYDAMEHFPDMMRQSPFMKPWLRPLLAAAVDAVERTMRRLNDLILTADAPTVRRFRRTRPTLVNFNFPSLKTFDSYDPNLLLELKKQYAGRLVIAYVGSMGWDRGLREMAHAMAIVRRAYPEAILLLLGGWQQDQWKQEFVSFVERLGQQDGVKLLGTVPHERLGAYLRTAEMGLAPLAATPKHEKNIPTKQFDYMCCGIPVIGNNVGPIRNFVLPSKAGLVIDTSNPQRLAEAILELLENPERAREMGANGRRAIESGWNWENEARRLREAFARMLSRPAV